MRFSIPIYMKKPKKEHLSWVNTWNNSMRFPVHSELKEIREEGGSMDSKEEIKNVDQPVGTSA